MKAIASEEEILQNRDTSLKEEPWKASVEGHFRLEVDSKLDAGLQSDMSAKRPT